ncbi:hypothetical protein M2272_004674 [Mycobacterium frederiksbergense]|uniref:PASTA domain-containing protein n=1 Tax=Mycolicibacterium frederiksbergense TaxID=117567 RepID=A0ABT6L504_9MYCO|nr:hypothetical protein [Mycolicibacterium frederiksbergense]MDH6198015.1 hypothetical protein [Mycolicibacterium frederiksbergense]
MKKKSLAFATLAASGLAAASVGLAAQVLAAPTGTESAQDIINQLQDDGYHVIVDKVGHGSLQECTVDNVRTVSGTGETILILQNPSRLGIPKVQGIGTMTAYVHVHC